MLALAGCSAGSSGASSSPALRPPPRPLNLDRRCADLDVGDRRAPPPAHAQPTSRHGIGLTAAAAGLTPDGRLRRLRALPGNLHGLGARRRCAARWTCPPPMAAPAPSPSTSPARSRRSEISAGVGFRRVSGSQWLAARVTWVAGRHVHAVRSHPRRDARYRGARLRRRRARPTTSSSCWTPGRGAPKHAGRRPRLDDLHPDPRRRVLRLPGRRDRLLGGGRLPAVA